MKIEILGTGCMKCKTLEEVVKMAVAKSGEFAQIEKVDDPLEIVDYGVMNTPGLVIDGRVLCSGKVPSVDEVIEMMHKSKIKS